MTRRSSDLPRKFYIDADVIAQEGAFVVALDGRGAKTPGGGALALPTAALGAVVADEWRRQGERIDFAIMPLTRLAFTAIDRVAEARDGVAAEVARYAARDLLCHLADAPQRLIDLQEAAWTPWRAWAADTLGLRLHAASGLLGPTQTPDAVAKAEALAGDGDDFALAGLALAAALLGSAVLAFALKAGALGADEAFGLSRLEEAFQEEFWGVDAEAAARTAALRLEACAAQKWFDALAGRTLG
jgi:chaperone required for assembly of F1-ATPase